MIKEIYDKGKVLLLGEDNEEPYVEIKQPEIDWGVTRWGGSGTTAAPFPPLTTMCSTSMSPGEYIPYPEAPPQPPILEWRCEGCESVMLAEYRQCEECGAPRHFLYGVDDDR